MPRKATIGKGRLFSQGWAAEGGRRDVVCWDVLDVRDDETLTVVFESTAGAHRQGVWLWTDGGISVDGQQWGSVDLWSDTAPRRVVFKCHTANGKLSIYNIWDHGHGRQSQCHSSGMLVTELPTGRKYRCNDIGFDGKFDKLVFRIERSQSRLVGNATHQRSNRAPRAKGTRPPRRRGKVDKGTGRTNG